MRRGRGPAAARLWVMGMGSDHESCSPSEAEPMRRRLDSVLEEVGDAREVRERTCTAAILSTARRRCHAEEALVKELRPDKRTGTTRTVLYIPQCEHTAGTCRVDYPHAGTQYREEIATALYRESL